MNKQFPNKSVTRIAALAMTAGSLLALPATAGAHVTTAVDAVSAHTDRADSALDRAGELFDRNRDRKAARAFGLSRREMGKARSEAATLRRDARSDSDRADAAVAQEIVASEQDENVDELVGMLDEADGRVESRIAKAALSDTRGRDKAIAVLSALLDEVPVEAQASLAGAIAELSQDRVPEVKAASRALVSEDVSNGSKRIVASTVESNVDGQKRASDELAALMASVDTPAEAQEGLQRAFDAVTADQDRSASVLSRFSDRMPAAIRSFVSEVVEQAQGNAQDLRENMPTPPVTQAQDVDQLYDISAGPPVGVPTP